jgi:hypothetical protein
MAQPVHPMPAVSSSAEVEMVEADDSRMRTSAALLDSLLKLETSVRCTAAQFDDLHMDVQQTEEGPALLYVLLWTPEQLNADQCAAIRRAVQRHGFDLRRCRRVGTVMRSVMRDASIKYSEARKSPSIQQFLLGLISDLTKYARNVNAEVADAISETAKAGCYNRQVWAVLLDAYPLDDVPGWICDWFRTQLLRSTTDDIHDWLKTRSQTMLVASNWVAAVRAASMSYAKVAEKQWLDFLERIQLVWQQTPDVTHERMLNDLSSVQLAHRLAVIDEQGTDTATAAQNIHERCRQGLHLFFHHHRAVVTVCSLLARALRQFEPLAEFLASELNNAVFSDPLAKTDIFGGVVTLLDVLLPAVTMERECPLLPIADSLLLRVKDSLQRLPDLWLHSLNSFEIRSSASSTWRAWDALLKTKNVVLVESYCRSRGFDTGPDFPAALVGCGVDGRDENRMLDVFLTQGDLAPSDAVWWLSCELSLCCSGLQETRLVERSQTLQTCCFSLLEEHLIPDLARMVLDFFRPENEKTEATEDEEQHEEEDMHDDKASAVPDDQEGSEGNGFNNAGEEADDEEGGYVHEFAADEDLASSSNDENTAAAEDDGDMEENDHIASHRPRKRQRLAAL